jgi:hypothetical protein
VLVALAIGLVAVGGAIGPHGPEVLSYELARTVLRDTRFTTARGLGLDVQGITSGSLCDRAPRPPRLTEALRLITRRMPKPRRTGPRPLKGHEWNHWAHHPAPNSHNGGPTTRVQI